MTAPQTDLSQLALDRTPAESTPRKQPRRRWAVRYLLPAGILAGFLALLGAAAGRQWMPRTSVTVVPVIVQRGSVQQAGTPLFQAAGWIEPRPTAVNVAALAPGVVEELLVVEGHAVTKGEPIARLIATDAELSVEQAEATLAIREGELARAVAERNAARTRLANPVHLKAEVAEAKSLLARATTELGKLPFLRRSAKANADFTRRSWENKKAAGAALAGVIIEQAEKEYMAAAADLEELDRRQLNLQLEIDALSDKAAALQERLQLLVEERRQVEEADAKVAAAEAIRDEAKLRVRQAELTLERMVIRAPMDGQVLRLVAFPGTRVMGPQHTDGKSSSTVVEMYDPQRLQVRADVRLEDVPQVEPGAPVEIETASSSQPIQGRVLRPTRSANIQKNTLEVKVELIDPPATVSPEMLATVTFLAPSGDAPAEPTAVDRILAPEQLIVSGDNGPGVWIVNAAEQAILKPITLGAAAADGLVEVTSGLHATDKIIASGREKLTTGDAVVVAGEDPSIGMGR